MKIGNETYLFLLMKNYYIYFIILYNIDKFQKKKSNKVYIGINQKGGFMHELCICVFKFFKRINKSDVYFMETKLT